MLYLCRVKPLRHYLRGFLIAAWAGDKIAEFSFPKISFHFPLRPWFFFVSPAYAGKRACTPCCTPVCGDHPRMCGEKKVMRGAKDKRMGSPPHVRGKVQSVSAHVANGGITPAYAGKRAAANFHLGTTRDHPRMCGEKKNICRKPKALTGSPPHVRGKVRSLDFCSSCSGITPACAGKSSRRYWNSSKHKDHPRMCGEKFIDTATFLINRGSPPHVRGKGPFCSKNVQGPGITPACAGKR